METKKIRGFTLIELLVVIAIIALLSSIVLTSLQDARLKAQDSKVIQQVREFQNAVAIFMVDNNHYPNTGRDVGTKVCIGPESVDCYFQNVHIETRPESDDFTSLLPKRYWVGEWLVPTANAASMSSYIAYNFINVPYVYTAEGKTGGGIIYECTDEDDTGDCSSAVVYWATAKPVQKGTLMEGTEGVYYQDAGDPGSGY
ncbi:MAG TPA: type II secretion system protein [Candidatus Paceibacterota bacterium]|nr:type II secretion system protein [Candidatus Paceibacterota bacterium]HRZ34321.1 type II secretion system protein [Candidatus Paceibacterota bacterium]